MSVDALRQVFEDPGPVPAGVQAVLIALAWRTPKGRDSTVPTSYQDISQLTHQAKSTVGRCIHAALESGVVEVVWARPGERTRYRINRGDWHIPQVQDELSTDLTMGSPPPHDEVGTQLTMGSGDLTMGSHKGFKEDKDLREADGDDLAVPAGLLPLVDRLRDKGLIG